MRCAWCKEDIEPGEKYYHGFTSGDLHKTCVKDYLVDMIKYEFTVEECAEMIELEEII